MRVLYVNHTAALGGCSSSLRILIESFPKGRVTPHLVCPDGPAVDQFRRLGVEVSVIPAVSMLASIAGVPMRGWRRLELLRTAWQVQYGPAVAQAIGRFKPDLVHLNERGMLQAAMIAGRRGVPVVMHARSVVDPTTPVVRRVGTWVMDRYVSCVMPIDESVSQSLVTATPRVVVYNAVSAGLRGRAEKTPPRDHRSGPLRVTYLTGLQAVKGVWDVMEAARRLRDRSDILFQIAGANPRPPSFYRSLTGRVVTTLGFAPDVESPLREFIAQHRLGATVQMLNTVRDIEQLLLNTDLMAFPSRCNGLGRSIFEGGVFGIPSVVSLRTPVGDVVENGESGITVPEGDVDRLAAAIATLADDRQELARLGANARARHLTQADPARAAAKVLEIYEKVAAGSLQPARGRAALTPITT
jgi:hypothetical protein